jgi:DNA polymerase elongation subunit (family B)
MKNASNPTDLNYYITNYILPALEGQMKRDSKGDLRSALDFVSNKGIVGLEKYDLRNLIRGLK